MAARELLDENNGIIKQREKYLTKIIVVCSSARNTRHVYPRALKSPHRQTWVCVWMCGYGCGYVGTDMLVRVCVWVWVMGTGTGMAGGWVGMYMDMDVNMDMGMDMGMSRDRCRCRGREGGVCVRM